VDNLLRDPRPVVLGLAAMLVGACAEMRPPAAVADPAGTDWLHARDVTIVMTEYRFTPSEVSLERGVAYRMQLENRGTELHEFTAPGFLAAVELRDGAVLAAAKNEIVVAPRTDRAIYFVARQAGRYQLSCADHDWAGMVGTIVIE
jgi:plastocyanin